MIRYFVFSILFFLPGIAWGSNNFFFTDASIKFWTEGLLVSLVAFIALLIWEIIDKPVVDLNALGEPKRKPLNPVDPFERLKAEEGSFAANAGAFSGEQAMAPATQTVSVNPFQAVDPTRNMQGFSQAAFAAIEEDEDPYKKLLRSEVTERLEKQAEEDFYDSDEEPIEPAVAIPEIVQELLEEDDPFKKLMKKSISESPAAPVTRVISSVLHEEYAETHVEEMKVEEEEMEAKSEQPPQTGVVAPARRHIPARGLVEASVQKKERRKITPPVRSEEELEIGNTGEESKTAAAEKETEQNAPEKLPAISKAASSGKTKRTPVKKRATKKKSTQE